ncbi:hypothetical protein KPH14_000936 [Odynerus spinipes]|uniref:CCHC-type domain-containing protein n=1 Tax=Odynerus spinipes TaxID=1348599 RepID=A0AAD9RDJ3_9HYME|nr:hypothetical protein KPH14_000936 [Odynerus spinipes]
MGKRYRPPPSSAGVTRATLVDRFRQVPVRKPARISTAHAGEEVAVREERKKETPRKDPAPRPVKSKGVNSKPEEKPAEKKSGTGAEKKEGGKPTDEEFRCWNCGELGHRHSRCESKK